MGRHGLPGSAQHSCRPATLLGRPSLSHKPCFTTAFHPALTSRRVASCTSMSRSRCCVPSNSRWKPSSGKASATSGRGSPLPCVAEGRRGAWSKEHAGAAGSHAASHKDMASNACVCWNMLSKPSQPQGMAREDNQGTVHVPHPECQATHLCVFDFAAAERAALLPHNV